MSLNFRVIKLKCKRRKALKAAKKRALMSDQQRYKADLLKAKAEGYKVESDSESSDVKNEAQPQIEEEEKGTKTIEVVMKKLTNPDDKLQSKTLIDAKVQVKKTPPVMDK